MSVLQNTCYGSGDEETYDAVVLAHVYSLIPWFCRQVVDFAQSRGKQLQGDHVVPLSRGGSNALVNIATPCRPCNLSKGSKTAEEWGSHKCINCRQRS